MKTELSLPTKLSEPSGRFLDYSILLHGEPKIGKTSLAAQFPDTVFLMLEPGAKALAVYQAPVRSWEDLKDFERLLRKSKHRFRTVVIDTVDLAYKYCLKAVCAKQGIEHPSEGEWGAGWEALRDEFSGTMNRFCSLGLGVLFISHTITKEVNRKAGGSYTTFVPSLPNLARQVLEPMVDIRMYYGYSDEGGRELWIRSTGEIAAGCRVEGHFMGVDKIDAGKSAKEAYANLMTAWKKTVEVSETKVKKTIKIRKG